LIKKVIDEYLSNNSGSIREYGVKERDINIFSTIYLLSEYIKNNNYLSNDDNLKIFANEKTDVNTLIYYYCIFILSILLFIFIFI
jgi:hypothetical protein